MKIFTVVLCVCMVVFVAISGCSQSYSTFNGTIMSFQYPSDCNVKELTSNEFQYSVTPKNHSVSVEKNGKIVVIERVNSSMADESLVISSYGYKYNGNFTNKESGIQYTKYDSPDPDYDENVFLFEKEGKVFKISGQVADQNTIEKIIETIQPR